MNWENGNWLVSFLNLNFRAQKSASVEPIRCLSATSWLKASTLRRVCSSWWGCVCARLHDIRESFSHAHNHLSVSSAAAGNVWNVNASLFRSVRARNGFWTDKRLFVQAIGWCIPECWSVGYGQWKSTSFFYDRFVSHWMPVNPGLCRLQLHFYWRFCIIDSVSLAILVPSGS